MTVIDSNFDDILHLQFQKLLEYMKKFWLGKIGVEGISVFMAPNACRTNNAVESWHSKLKQEVGAHPSVWNLIGSHLSSMNEPNSLNVCYSCGTAWAR